MTLKKLQESWPPVKGAIEELEKEGKVLVIRTGGSGDREGQIKMVFWDELPPVSKIDKGELQVFALPLLLIFSLFTQNSTQCGMV